MCTCGLGASKETTNKLRKVFSSSSMHTPYITLFSIMLNHQHPSIVNASIRKKIWSPCRQTLSFRLFFSTQSGHGASGSSLIVIPLIDVNFINAQTNPRRPSETFGDGGRCRGKRDFACSWRLVVPSIPEAKQLKMVIKTSVG